LYGVSDTIQVGTGRDLSLPESYPILQRSNVSKAIGEPYFNNKAGKLKYYYKNSAGLLSLSCITNNQYNMPGKYDKILRENIEIIIPFIIEHLLGIPFDATQVIKDKLKCCSLAHIISLA
jgi:hypothetical protein